MYKTFTKLLLTALLFSSLAANADIRTGAERTDMYLTHLKGKKIALVVNQTSIIGKDLLVDFFIKQKLTVVKIFAPEHGFRGNAEAGANVFNYKDKKTKLPVVSLYGKKLKPDSADLEGVDLVIFDIQDVGVRFYTYISTLHYIMEACAENNKPLMLLDRPNPLGFYVDGPVLEKGFESFVGMHPVPIVYGMTIGEYAGMINGERWLKNGMRCKLEVIPCDGYNHEMLYKLPVPPSPNLPTMEAIYLYPSLCLFEGTDISVGRGTPYPFEVIGKPDFTEGNMEFTPKPIKGKADNPMYNGIKCKGFKLTKFAGEYIIQSKQLYLFWLTGCYKASKDKEHFFNPFFDKLAGTDKLRLAITHDLDGDKIRNGWKPDLDTFKETRKKYLLYRDFVEGK
ncbi:MAG: DUF1343 domain-containing protein [Bacteroidetes bacterium]|nr:DUF1343 domain-containing protein [Bacteroidota bacterium]